MPGKWHLSTGRECCLPCMPGAVRFQVNKNMARALGSKSQEASEFSV